MKSFITACTGVIALSTLASADIQPVFNKDTGLWIGISQGSKIIKSESTAPDVRINTSQGWQLDGKQSTNAVITKRDNTWTVKRKEGEWLITSKYIAKANEIKRSTVITYLGSQEVRLYGVSLLTPELAFANDATQYALIPGEYPVQPMTFSSWQPGQDRIEIGWTRAEFNIALLHSPKAKLSLIAGYQFVEDQARVGVHQANKAVSLFHQFDTAMNLKPGAKAFSVGEQRIRLVNGSDDDLLKATSIMVNDLEDGPASNPPSWLFGGTVYEVHPWGPLEIWGSGDNGQRYDRLQRLMPYYKQLGVNILWHLPTQAPPPWVYTTMGQGLVNPANGTKQQLKDMIAAGHKLGIRSLSDLVVYGIHPDAPDVKTLPDEVWARNTNNQIENVWGGTIKPIDASSKPWQSYIKKAAHNWASEYGFDGARLDVGGWGQVYNWANPYKANISVAMGGMQLNKAVRDGFREVVPDAMILPEIGKPIAFRQSDLQFDYPFYLVMRDMLTTSDVPTWIENAKLWLDWQRSTNPTAVMHGWGRFTDNHDTVPPDCFFGAGINQAFLSIICFIEGTPVLYQDQETGFSEELARWLALRPKWDCFSHGSAEYSSITSSDPNVFSFIRVGKDSAAVVAVNLSDQPVDTTIAVPASVVKDFKQTASALPGTSAHLMASNSVQMTIPAYRPAILIMSKKPVDFENANVQAPQMVDALQNGYNPETGELVVDNATYWELQTPEGNLREKFQDWGIDFSKTSDPLKSLPVLRRMWSPLDTSLLDGCQRALIGIQTSDNKLIAAAVDPSKATTVQIIDDKLDGKHVKLVIKPAEAVMPLSSNAPKMTPKLDVGSSHVVISQAKSHVKAIRRMGGVPLNITVSGKQFSSHAATAYTDYGFFGKGSMVSANGDTNPRFAATSTDEAKSLVFNGKMHGSSWNGVQTCDIASPELDYEISYDLRKDGSVAITFSVIATQDRPEGSAFAGISIPLDNAMLMQSGTEDSAQGRNCVLKAPGSIKLFSGKSHFDVTWGAGNGTVFTIGQKKQVAGLFICAADGPIPAMKKGDRLTQTAIIR